MVWIPPSNITVPVTQQDSLPLFALGQAGTAGYFVSFAGTVFRYWNHAQLFGLRLPAEDVPLVGFNGIASDVLDLRGCRELALVAKRVTIAAVPAGYLLKVYIWPQFSDGAANLFAGDVRDSCNAFSTSLSPLSAGLGSVYVYNATISRGPAGAGGAGGVKNLSAAFGIGFARIVVTGFTGLAINPWPAGGIGDPTFTWELWGQG